VARACPARRISAGGSATPVIIYAAAALTRSDACAGRYRALGCPGKQLGNSVEAACGRAPSQDRYQPTDDPAKCQTSCPTTWRSVKLSGGWSETLLCGTPAPPVNAASAPAHRHARAYNS
jgi:hypothetical protein